MSGQPDPPPEPRLPGAPLPDPDPVPDEVPVPPNPDERRVKRTIMRTARLLIGTIVALFALGLVYRLLRGEG
ncbi:MAG: hypothetical protein ACYTG2_19090 [Planctomycetota bacterium]